MAATSVVERLHGIFVPAVTPFTDDGSLDLHAVETNLMDWGRTGVRGYRVLGSDGEFRSLDDDEAIAVVGRTAEVLGDRSPAGERAHPSDKTLVVGAGRESLRLTLDFIDRLAAVGRVDAVAVLTPHYFPGLMSAEVLARYYCAVADRSPLPVIVKVAPSFASGVILPASAVADLADHPNVCGTEESSAEVLTAILAKGPRDDFAVLAGSVATLMTCLVHGGAGGVVSPANYLPETCARVLELFATGHRDEAGELLERLGELVSRTAGEHGVAGVKASMNAVGLAGGVPRLPVPAVPDADARRLADALRDWVSTIGLR